MNNSLSPWLNTEVYLVYGSLRMGGIETLILRMANYFTRCSVKVNVCYTEGGSLDQLFESGVSLIKYGSTKELVTIIDTQKYNWAGAGSVLLVSFDPISAGRCLMIESKISNSFRIIHISGVFHPRAYFMTGERRDRVALNYLVALAVGKKNLFFMNRECKDSHVGKWGTSLSECSVLPLPVDHWERIWRLSRGDTLRIVSVGRIVDFKAYNLGCARIVRECLNLNVAITWDIYGNGPLCHAIETEISKHNVAGNVRLMGELDYRGFKSKVAEYDLFVGMGTAAIESAMIGVPTICATVDVVDKCYGYFSDLPFGNIGEMQSAAPNLEIGELIRQYASSDKGAKVKISKACRAAAERYAMPRFIDAVARLADSGHQPPKFIKFFAAYVYSFVTESWAAKAVRSLFLHNSGPA